MNVNGSRFHLLLGAADWRRCEVGNDGSRRSLADWWSESEASPAAAAPAEESGDSTLEPAPLTWDSAREELRLQRSPIRLDATPGEKFLTPEARRSAGADENGNIYWIDTDPHRLRVWSVGSEQESAFWPVGPGGCAHLHRKDRGDLSPMAESKGIVPVFEALTVTEDHYLVVAFRASERAGLFAFDLVAGGPPGETLWPAGIPVAPFAMAARIGGGILVLDRQAARLWELDRHLAIVGSTESAGTGGSQEPELFQPLAGSRRARPTPLDAAGLDLRAVTSEAGAPISDPIAVTASGEDLLFILDRNGPHGPSRVYRLTLSQGAWRASSPSRLPHLAQDFVLAEAKALEAGASSRRLLISTASGNQVLAFVPTPDSNEFRLSGAAELFPLRRYGGRALIRVKGAAYYDSGGSEQRWVRVVQQPRARYRERAELITPVLDGEEQQCVWDRLMLDACIPPDARVQVWCRASDDRETRSGKPDDPAGPWVPQPRPRLRDGGAELPWLRAAAQRPTRKAAGAGTWELLIQRQRGRYLQLRLRLSGNGRVTPWLRALRVWYPRFSYPEQFLPAVYREDAFHGDFLERFLANMESVNTELEGRIAQVQALLDPRTVPADALDWLASWFDLALDPAWEERRRRLFVTHAMGFFRWRGTAHGLRIALALAVEPCVGEPLFEDPENDDDRRHRIRIVESYQTRSIGALAAGDPGAEEPGGPLGSPRPLSMDALWNPREGVASLVERYAQTVMNREATNEEQLQPLPLMPPTDPDMTEADRGRRQAAWTAFFRLNLGFVPEVGAADRRRWQAFLAAGYPNVEALAEAHEENYGSFDEIDLPVDWPEQEKLSADWRTYCALPDRTRMRWRGFLARRYRHIERLQTAYDANWPGFALVPLPDYWPATPGAQRDWLQFEGRLLPMASTAHRFSVLLPVSSVTETPAEMERRRELARRILELEKPAHTVCDVRFYWSLNRIGEARLGLDTLLDTGSRAKELVPDTVLGHAYLGAGFVGGPSRPATGDRRLLAC